MFQKFSEMQISRFLVGKKNRISKKTCAVCFRNFEMGPRNYEKDCFRIIRVDLRVPDKEGRNKVKVAMALCPYISWVLSEGPK
jgi:hypothetical protein